MTQSYIAQIYKQFNATAAQGVDIVFQFNLKDSEHYYLAVKDGHCDMQQGDHINPNVTLLMSISTLKNLAKGDVTGMQAFMTGQLKIEGNTMLALKLNDLFSL